MTSSVSHLQLVRQQILRAEQKWKRNSNSVTLLAVSKTRGADELEILISQGQLEFGENYLQEALEKQALLTSTKLVWHFIGSLQSNKTRLIAEHFDWVHSIERLKIASRLNEHRPSHLAPLNVLIQVNVSLESSKSGILQDQLLPLADEINQLPNLRLRGIMGLPVPATEFTAQLKQCEILNKLFIQLKQSGEHIDTLSMGTSNDYEAAISAGATMVRLGTAIFGKRPIQ